MIKRAWINASIAGRKLGKCQLWNQFHVCSQIKDRVSIIKPLLAIRFLIRICNKS